MFKLLKIKNNDRERIRKQWRLPRIWGWRFNRWRTRHLSPSSIPHRKQWLQLQTPNSSKLTLH